MIKKTITYNDFNGKAVTEDFYFNLTKTEIVELEVSEKKGLAETLKEIVASQDNAEIIKNFKMIILASYGIKSEDGRRFIKNQALRDEFEQTPAFSELFIELATNADIAAKFIAGVVPQDMEAAVIAEARKMDIRPLPDVVEVKPVEEMSREELIEMMKSKNNG